MNTLNPEMVGLCGLMLLIISLVVSVLFGKAASMDGYKERRRRARHDVILARTLRDKRRDLCAVDIPADAQSAEVGDMAIMPNGQLALMLGQFEDQCYYQFGNGPTFELGEHAKADYLRGPFPADT